MDDSVSSLVLEEPLLSFESIVSTTVPVYRDDILVPGILRSFDLPEVYQAGCLKRVTLINPLRGDRKPAAEDEVARVYEPVFTAYRAAERPGDWRVFARSDPDERAGRIVSGLLVRGD
jgi:hypothetical protein